MDPATIIGLGQMAVSGVENAINNSQQKKINDRAERYSEYQYDRNRAHALQDWHMQNAYNAPAAQMERYKKAGLNPALIYGQSNAASPIAQTSAGSQNPNRQAPQVNFGGVLAGIYDIQRIQAQTDNLRAQAEAARAKTATEPYKRSLTIQQIASESQRRQFGAELQDYNLESLQSQNRLRDKQARLSDAQRSKVEADTNFTIRENVRKDVMLGNTLADSLAKRLKMAAETTNLSIEKHLINEKINNLMKDSKIKNFEIQLNRMGLTRSDPAAIRLMNQAIDEYLEN